MTSFMHKLVEELRTREQFLEEHSTNPIFDNDENGQYKQEYNKLRTDLTDFVSRVEKVSAKGNDYDEHFEREINDEHQRLSVKVDAWSKKLEN